MSGLQQLLNRISKWIRQKAADAAVGQTRPEAAQLLYCTRPKATQAAVGQTRPEAAQAIVG